MKKEVLEKIRQLQEQAEKLKGQPIPPSLALKNDTKDFLAENIKTQEQADHFMMQLKALTKK